MRLESSWKSLGHTASMTVKWYLDIITLYLSNPYWPNIVPWMNSETVINMAFLSHMNRWTPRYRNVLEICKQILSWILQTRGHAFCVFMCHICCCYMKERGTQSNYKLKWLCMEPLGYPNLTFYYLLGAELIVDVKPTREYILKLAILQPHNQKFDLWHLLLLDEVSVRTIFRLKLESISLTTFISINIILYPCDTKF